MFKRFNKLVEEVRKRYPDDSFFADFESSCKENRLKREFYQSYEDAIATLKDSDWTVLMGKAIRHFKDHRIGQLKTGFFAVIGHQKLIPSGHHF